MKKRNLNIALIIVSLISLGYLINLLLKLPAFMLVSTSMKIMILSTILIGSFIFGLILKFIFKKINFKTIFFSLLTICSLIGIVYFFTPTYKIIVPKNYVGEVNLILSNVKENLLILDKNGIGYINQKTFKQTFKPIIIQNGNKINKRAIGYSPSTFWSKLITTTSDGKKIEALNFLIVPDNDNDNDKKQNDNFDLIKLVDYELVLTE